MTEKVGEFLGSEADRQLEKLTLTTDDHGFDLIWFDLFP